MKNRIKILIMDDQPSFVGGLNELMLRFPQFKILDVAYNRKGFENVLKKKAPGVVILNLENWRELALLIQKSYRNVDIVVSSSCNPTAGRSYEAMKRFNDALLEPPVSSETILQRIFIKKAASATFRFLIGSVLQDIVCNRASVLPKIHSLSHREEQVVSLLCLDYSNKEIAEILGLGWRTVETYRKTAINKIGAAGTGGLIMYGFENKLDVKFKYQKNNRKMSDKSG